MRYRIALIVLVLFIGVAIVSGSYTQFFNQQKPGDNSLNQEAAADNKSAARIYQEEDSDRHHRTTDNSNPRERSNTDYKDRYLNEYTPKKTPKWVSGENFSMDSDVNIYEVNKYPYTEPTEEQLEAAWELYNTSYNAAQRERLFNFKKARREGYKARDFIHHVNKEYYLDGETLNPNKPEGLVYYSNFSADEVEPDDAVLAGYVYVEDNLTSHGQQVGGPLTVWHFHPQNKPQCFASRLNKGFEFEGIECPKNSTKRKRSPEMIHVWFIKHPEGPFSTDIGSFEYAEQVYEKWNGSGGMPEKMSEKEFKSYAMESYNKHAK